MVGRLELVSNGELNIYVGGAALTAYHRNCTPNAAEIAPPKNLNIILYSKAVDYHNILCLAESKSNNYS
mgnify:CR=1 FL=1